MRPRVLGLLFLLALQVWSQAPQAADEYLPIFRPLAHGQAPHMQAQLLGEAAGVRTYMVVFGTGDELLAGLTEFAESRHLRASRVTGIGAVESSTLGWLDLDRKMYRVHRAGQAEVTSLVGDIAELKGKPSVHVHLTLGHPDGHVTGGHMLEAVVRPTLEVLVTEYPHGLQKRLDESTGLGLIVPRP